MAEETKTEEATEAKSIVDPKYREKYKTPDWLGSLINGVVSTEVEKTRKVDTGKTDKEDKPIMKDEKYKVAGPVDIDKLFALAEENGLAERVEKYKDQRDNHGFAGRFRMTVRNMLQARARKAHGLYINGKWVKADAEWLEAKDAPEAPTHNRDGEKIAKKADKADKAKENA